MNPIQEKVFQMLQAFTQICDRLHLKCFLVCGSALGAVKYGGFIPWDDDVDVALFRSDYERFCKEAPALLPAHLFLQNFRSDPAFPAIYSKLRDSRTTCIEESVAALPIHHGISLDIFPLDGYPKDKKEQKRLERRKAWFVRKLSIPCVRPERWKEMLVKPLRALGFGKNTAQTAEAYTALISVWPVENSDIIANHGNWQGRLEYHRKEIYGEGSRGSFEGAAVRLPADCDAYLRQKYGDYRQDPPPDKQRSHHRYQRLDAERPYTEFLNLRANVLKNTIKKPEQRKGLE